MSSLKMNPTRDAGRFAYHLKFLLKAELLEVIVTQKKYCLTDLGKMVIDVADRIDKKATKPKNILVRESRSAIEEFDANRIASTLIKEAKMPVEQAQKVAKEAEAQLIKSKAKYLTAPLVREVVNAILIEKGLEEYRNKLTRLGIPVHDLANLLHPTHHHTNPLEAAGETVLKEYTLLNALPRDIADAHFSGTLHINNLPTWLLKPTETIHDTRFFLQNGLNLETINPINLNHPPPQTLETALNTIYNALLHAAEETETTQTLEYFNIFLATYTANQKPTETQQALRQFLTNLTQHTDAAITLELSTPKFLQEKTAFGPKGKQGKHKDYTEQTQQLASQIIDAYAEITQQKPQLTPSLIIKIRQETFKDTRANALLLKAHALATGNGTPYFADLTEKPQEQTVHTPSGLTLNPDPNGDWEIDTVRTGSLGQVTINMPRAAYEAEKDKARFNEILRERLEMAERALEIKHQALTQHAKNLLPFLSQPSNGDTYFRLEKTERIINLAGLTQAAENFTGKPIQDETAQTFLKQTAQTINEYLNKIGRKRSRHLHTATLPNTEATTRLAQLDIERYGIGRVHYAGTRDKPYYTTTTKLTPTNLNPPNIPPQLQTSGNLTTIEKDETPTTAEQLYETTKQLLTTHKTRFFTYNQPKTYCTNCKKTWPGLKPKCPQCNAISTLTHINRHNQT